MTKSVRLHPAVLDKYAEWRDTLPGATEDATQLLGPYFEDFAKRAIAHAARKRLGSEPFEFEGPASQWFLIAVTRLNKKSKQVLILDLIDSPDDQASR